MLGKLSSEPLGFVLAKNKIIVTMIDSPLIDFNLYSDTTLSTMATSFESEYKNAGVTVINYEIYQNSQAKFLKIYISQPNGDSTAYGLQYYTVYADKAINITMQSYLGQITLPKETILQDIVDSAIFDTDPQTAESEFTPTDSFTYTDLKTQSTFTVPANWVEEALSKERVYIDTKFVSNKEVGLSILYGSTDAYDMLPELNEDNIPRSAVNMELLSEAEIKEVFKEMYGDNASNVSSVKYGENTYFIMQVSDYTEVSGIEFKPTITQVICIDNGYFYSFMFYGTSDNSYYEDFESLLSSVRFATSDIKSGLDNSNDLTSKFSLGNLLLSLLVTIIVYSLPIIIYRYAIRKAPVDRKKAKKITIIYGVCAFVVMSVLIFVINGSGAAGGAILLWSWVNYRVLIGGKSPEANLLEIPAGDADSIVPESCDSTENTEQIAPDSIPNSNPDPIEYQKYFVSSAEPEHREFVPSDKEIKYCHRCGNKLQSDSLFCTKCGAKIPL